MWRLATATMVEYDYRIRRSGQAAESSSLVVASYVYAVSQTARLDQDSSAVSSLVRSEGGHRKGQKQERSMRTRHVHLLEGWMIGPRPASHLQAH